MIEYSIKAGICSKAEFRRLIPSKSINYLADVSNFTQTLGIQLKYDFIH